MCALQSIAYELAYDRTCTSDVNTTPLKAHELGLARQSTDLVPAGRNWAVRRAASPLCRLARRISRQQRGLQCVAISATLDTQASIYPNSIHAHERVTLVPTPLYLPRANSGLNSPYLEAESIAIIHVDSLHRAHTLNFIGNFKHCMTAVRCLTVTEALHRLCFFVH